MFNCYFGIFCSSISMGKEVEGMCTYEQSDCVLSSPASDNVEGLNDNASKYLRSSGPERTLMGNPDCSAFPEALGSKEEAAKEDSVAFPVEISMSQTNSCLMERELPCVGNLNLDTVTEETKKVNRVEQKTTHSQNFDHPVKLASKSTPAENVKASRTVPQPFAPMSDKRAAGASRSLPPNVVGEGKKNSNSNRMQPQNLVKKAQVLFFSLFLYVLLL